MLHYMDLHFRAVKEQTTTLLPPFLGITLRGAFGMQLKRIVCQVRHGQCLRCLLRPACPYPSIFEGLPPDNRAMLRKYPAIPQPFLLLVPAPGPCQQEEAHISWGLRLFGPAARYWPYVVHTFDVAGQQGIGRGRCRFRLERVTDGDDGPDLLTAAAPQPRRREVPQCTRVLPERCVLRWSFQTPLRLSADGRLRLDGLSPLDLLKSGRRRLAILSHFYGLADNTEVEAEAHLDASEFRIIESDLHVWRSSRFSNRQRQRMDLDGLIGTITIEGPWGRAGAWLAAAPTIHLGKATSFGFGRVSWELV
jgi:hypothetical protein